MTFPTLQAWGSTPGSKAIPIGSPKADEALARQFRDLTLDPAGQSGKAEHSPVDQSSGGDDEHAVSAHEEGTSQIDMDAQEEALWAIENQNPDDSAPADDVLALQDPQLAPPVPKGTTPALISTPGIDLASGESPKDIAPEGSISAANGLQASSNRQHVSDDWLDLTRIPPDRQPAANGAATSGDSGSGDGDASAAPTTTSLAAIALDHSTSRPAARGGRDDPARLLARQGLSSTLVLAPSTADAGGASVPVDPSDISKFTLTRQHFEASAAEHHLYDVRDSEGQPGSYSGTESVLPLAAGTVSAPLLNFSPAGASYVGAPMQAGEMMEALRQRLATGAPPPPGEPRVTELMLSPGELGQVRIRLVSGRNGLELKITAAKSAGADAVRKHMTAFHRGLMADGIQLDKFELAIAPARAAIAGESPIAGVAVHGGTGDSTLSRFGGSEASGQQPGTQRQAGQGTGDHRAPSPQKLDHPVPPDPSGEVADMVRTGRSQLARAGSARLDMRF